MTRVFLTVDVEVWPVHPGGWPHRPLHEDARCEREIAGYLDGLTPSGRFGVPYQLEVLERHGLKATFFVDPLFSFALGIEPLARIVRMIEQAGQAVALHLHPEWLTDPRCRGLPGFRGPMISSYPVDEQLELVRAGLGRLREAGADPIPAFRAGSWGADLETLDALREAGLQVDSSLNARMSQSFPGFERRGEPQDPQLIRGIVELPVSRLDDRRVAGGRVVSFVGNSAAEIEFLLQACLRAERRSVVLVLHSNEFVKTERLWQQRPLAPRRMVVRRFERVCRLLGTERGRMPTDFVTAAIDLVGESSAAGFVPRSHLRRTLARNVEQLISRWY